MRPDRALWETTLRVRVVTPEGLKYIYGPVPSRRLGRSLGIDLVPYKTCTYDCIYCQLGPTTQKTLERKEYVTVSEILSELDQHQAGSHDVDYISLAGSGEPTLNSGIRELIRRIKRRTSTPLAVLTNGSLLWMKDVQDALMPADLVIPSLDAGDPNLFQYVNRPHKDISFEQMVHGLVDFAGRFRGEIWLEVLLLSGVTGIRDEVEKINSLIKGSNIARIQMNTVARPPAKSYAKPLSQKQMAELKGLFSGRTEIIGDFDHGDRQGSSDAGSVRSAILSMLNRRPCTGMDIACSLGLNPSEALKHLDALLLSDQVTTVRMNEKVFFASKELRDPEVKIPADADFHWTDSRHYNRRSARL